MIGNSLKKYGTVENILAVPVKIDNQILAVSTFMNEKTGNAVILSFLLKLPQFGAEWRLSVAVEWCLFERKDHFVDLFLYTYVFIVVVKIVWEKFVLLFSQIFLHFHGKKLLLKSLLRIYLAVWLASASFSRAELISVTTMFLNLTDDCLWDGFIIAGWAVFEDWILMGARCVSFWDVRELVIVVGGLGLDAIKVWQKQPWGWGDAEGRWMSQFCVRWDLLRSCCALSVPEENIWDWGILIY